MVTYLSKNMLPELPEIVRAEGVLAYDAAGTRYFDLTSQCLNLNLGHSHPAVVGAVSALLSKKGFPYYVSPRFRSRYAEELAERIVEHAPRGLSKVNLQMCNGSDANEDALKRVRKYHFLQRGMTCANIVSFYGSHLGESSETISASGEHFGKESYFGGSGNYVFMDPCDNFHRPRGLSEQEYAESRLNEFERLFDRREDIAGIIMELITFDAGVLIQPKNFVRGLVRLCQQHDRGLIIDEVQTAFGWCGSMFASDVFGIRPDIITMAKGMTGGFPAMAATVFKEKYDILESGASEYTFGAQSIGCVAALATMQFLTTSGIMETVPKKHARVMETLQVLRKRYHRLADVRGMGMFFGLEFVKPDGQPDYTTAKRVYRSAFKSGLLLNPPTTDPGLGAVVAIKPPLTITMDEVEQAMQLLERSFRMAAGG